MMEMMFVLLIIAIIIAVSLPSLNGYLLKSKINEVEVDLRVMKSDITQYYVDNSGVELLVSENPEEGESAEVSELRNYLSFETEYVGKNSKDLKEYQTINKLDPWKNGYRLFLKEDDLSFIVLMSYGPNGKKDLTNDNAGDDIIMVYYTK